MGFRSEHDQIHSGCSTAMLVYQMVLLYHVIPKENVLFEENDDSTIEFWYISYVQTNQVGFTQILTVPSPGVCSHPSLTKPWQR
jgi:hypothetical protein